MAPDPLAAGQGGKIESMLDFSRDLISKLPTSRDLPSIEPLLADLNHHIHTVGGLQQKPPTISPQHVRDLKHFSRKLWNDCIKETRMILEATTPTLRARLLVRTRVFAFQLLMLGMGSDARRKKRMEHEVTYMMEKALTLSRVCLADRDLDGARMGLQKVAEYVEQLKTLPLPDLADDPMLRSKLEVQYLTMRIALAWEEDRLDVAEHMFGKTENLRSELEPASAEHMADILEHIGSSQASKKDYPMALKWLRRAYELINAQDLGRLSAKGLELRFSICHDLVQALLGVGSEESIQEASNLVAYIESEVGDKPVVLHWRLEILQKSPSETLDTDSYASLLRRMIRSIDLTDDGITFLLHHIKDILERSASLAIGLLDELLFARLLQSDNAGWIGKGVVRRIWMSTMQVETSGATDLMNFLDRIQEETGSPLTPDVTGAAHSLIWKKLEASYAKEQFEAGVLWCQAALHPIFSSCGDTNLGKFGRKLMLCALGASDAEAAVSAFHSMPDTAQNNPLTRYLMFKASLVGWDHELGRQSIEFLSKSADSERTQDILYACIREAQQVSDRLCTLAALKAVADRYELKPSTAANFPTILRCTIKLINLIENQDDQSPPQDSGFAEDTCEIFEKAAEYARQGPKDENGNKVFTVSELEWFRKNAYNIGVTKCSGWDLPHLVRIFNVCVGFIAFYPHDMGSKDMSEMSLMAMRCHFIVAVALVSQARTEEKVDEQLQRYLEARQHISKFDQLLQSEIESRKGDITRDLVAKMATLFVFDFEGAVCLKSWDELGQIVRKAKVCKDEAMYKAMGDCLLRSWASGKVIYSTMRLIINEVFALEDFDSQKLAKYLRCIYQVILPLDDGLALQVVDQAIQIAREGSQLRRPFPGDELDWVVATTFNHAIDVYARGDEELCHRWALKALDLAECIDDGGRMKEVLQERVVKLRFRQQKRGK